MALQVAEQMADYLLTGAVINALNMPSVSAEEAPKLRPYMRARRTARQLRRPAHRERPEGRHGRIRGPCRRAQHPAADGLGAGGLLRPLLDSVNMVNAPVIARGAQHRDGGDQARPGRRLPDVDPPDRRHRAAGRAPSPARCSAARSRGSSRSRALPIEAELAAHALHHQRGQAGLHRPSRHARWAMRASTSRPSTSAAPHPATTPSRWCGRSADQRRSAARIGGLPSVVRAKALSF